MGMRAAIIWKIRKNWHNTSVFSTEFGFFFRVQEQGIFDRVDVFLTKYELESFGFFMKSRKIRLWGLFGREEVYLTKYGHERISFFMKNRETMAWEYFVFDLIITKYGHESSSFFMKNQGKVAWEQFFFFFQRGCYYHKIWAWSFGFFMKNRKKRA